MFRPILTYLKEGSVYAGLEIYGDRGTEKFCYMELERRKNELDIRKKVRPATWEGALSGIGKGVPLFLTINTANVLTKQLHGPGTSDPKALVNEAFPNLDLDNFYYEVSQMSKDPIIAISKKEYVDGIIEKLGRLERQLMAFSLGPVSFSGISPFIGNGEISISNALMTISQGTITKIVPQEEIREQYYTINQLEIPHFYLLPFSNVYGHLADRPVHSNFRERSDALLSNFHNYRAFDRVLRSSLIFFLVLLMANFFIFDHFSGQVRNFKNFMDIHNSDRDLLKELEIQVGEKQHRIELLDLGAGSRATYFLDEIGQGVPSDILLDRITYLPLARPLRDSRPIELDKNTILVKGISYNDSSYSSWLAILERKTWVSAVETLDYDYLTRESSTFLINITLHETQ